MLKEIRETRRQLELTDRALQFTDNDGKWELPRKEAKSDLNVLFAIVSFMDTGGDMPHEFGNSRTRGANCRPP